MRDFQFLIADDRYSAPSLRLVQVHDELRALELAEKALAESPHHLSVEVWEGDDRVRVLTAGAGSASL